MSKHVAFEYGVAITFAALPSSKVMPKFGEGEIKNPEIHEAFYDALKNVADLKMYDRFRKKGWTSELAFETRDVLLPEIIKAISLAWLSSIPKEQK
jgi:hypothetical protein